ncbi:MAG: pyridoxal-phosphate dependent enzyme [Bacteroidetes bacterium]|nr:pyridoxal-phosphate dependent enzyme [Bacteroidota bacterium]
MVRNINSPFLVEKEIKLSVLLTEKPDTPGGNKHYKLKYNIEKMFAEGLATLLTFGGAFSNHILATAIAGKKEGFKTIGIIRGEELNPDSNSILKDAHNNGMQLHFVSREEYRKKDTPEFISQLIKEFGNFYSLPEGGSNTLAVKGCEEILLESHQEYNYITCAVGTGATLAGIINASNNKQKVIGISVLQQSGWLEKQVESFLMPPNRINWELNNDYTFGKYGNANTQLIDFYFYFKQEFGIELDLVYSAKMMFGIFDMIKKNKIEPGSSILAIHTGGTHGNKELIKKYR